MKYNIVFLDFDGVLNNMTTLVDRARNLKKGETKEYDLKLKSTHKLDEFWANEMVWKNVESLIKCLSQLPNVKIVLSTSWRNSKSVEHWNYQFNLIEGWDFEIISKTPTALQSEKSYEVIGGYTSSLCRGIEVQRWLDRNFNLVNNYCIIDDDSDMLLSQSSHFVQTNSDVGFCESDSDKVIEILTRY